MGKKIKILPILCFAGVILLLCAALLFIENIYYQLSIIVFVFILANSLIYFSKRMLQFKATYAILQQKEGIVNSSITRSQIE